jgi:hypothetical protein
VNTILITSTRRPHLKAPEALPQVEEVAAREWFSGWWHGLPTGFCIGLVLGAIVLPELLIAIFKGGA